MRWGEGPNERVVMIVGIGLVLLVSATSGFSGYRSASSRRSRQGYPQVGDKSYWNSRERVLEPEELSSLQATDK